MKEIKKIDVMLLAQPWIQCVLYSNKNVENKSVNKKMRGTVAIYSSINKKTKDLKIVKHVMEYSMNTIQKLQGKF